MLAVRLEGGMLLFVFAVGSLFATRINSRDHADQCNYNGEHGHGDTHTTTHTKAPLGNITESVA